MQRLARFPNGLSPYGRLNQHGDITHITTLTPHSIQHLALETGYTVEFIGNDILPLNIKNPTLFLLDFSLLALRKIFEIPHQILFNLYYIGKIQSYPLAPNLVCILKKSSKAI